MVGKGPEAGAEPASMTLRAIGFVKNEIKKPSRQEFGEIISEVVIDESLTEALRAIAGNKVQVDVSVDPSLIGGLVVQVGSRMIDNSLKTKLQRLQLPMNGGG